MYLATCTRFVNTCELRVLEQITPPTLLIAPPQSTDRPLADHHFGFGSVKFCARSFPRTNARFVEPFNKTHSSSVWCRCVCGIVKIHKIMCFSPSKQTHTHTHARLQVYRVVAEKGGNSEAAFPLRLIRANELSPSFAFAVRAFEGTRKWWKLQT